MAAPYSTVSYSKSTAQGKTHSQFVLCGTSLDDDTETIRRRGETRVEVFQVTFFSGFICATESFGLGRQARKRATTCSVRAGQFEALACRQVPQISSTEVLFFRVRSRDIPN